MLCHKAEVLFDERVDFVLNGASVDTNKLVSCEAVSNGELLV